MNLLQKGRDKGYIKLDAENKFITNIISGKRYRFNDPEEKVRATAPVRSIA